MQWLIGLNNFKKSYYVIQNFDKFTDMLVWTFYFLEAKFCTLVENDDYWHRFDLVVYFVPAICQRRPTYSLVFGVWYR